MDAIPHLFEVEDLRDEPLTGHTNDPNSFGYVYHDYTEHLDETYDMVKQWSNVMKEYNSRAMMMEAYANITKTMDYYKAGATFPFNFDFITSFKRHSNAQHLKNIINKWMSNMPIDAVANWVVSIISMQFISKNV